MEKDEMKKCGCEHEDHDESCDCGCGSHDDGCDCGCGCDDQDSVVVELEDENGNVIPCEMVDRFVYKENEYALVQNPDNGEVYLFKIETVDDEPQLTVPDDAEFEEVSKYYEDSVETEE